MFKALRVIPERSAEMCCKFCEYGNDRHATDCPRTTPGADERYEEGYRAGRSGKERTESAMKDPAYSYGYLRGERALENAQNGCSW